MSFRNLPLPAGIRGKLYLHSMPGRDTRYADDVREIASKNISTVVRLTSDEETAEESPGYWDAIEMRSIRWQELHFPIQDYGVPDNPVAFGTFVDFAANELSRGQVMLLHCAAGIGRTGTVACAILIQLGVKLEEAVRIVSEAGSYAEDRLQVDFLRAFAKGH